MRLLRALLTPPFIAIATIVGAILAFTTRLWDSSGDRILDLARLWSRAVLGFAGVKIDVEWREPLDRSRPYVFMANHLSSVDIWALFVALPFRFRMLAKKQLAAIPLFGWAMAAGRFIFIDRANAVAARRSIEEARNRIAGGQSVLLFPEGTRSRDGRMMPFKKGGFHLAIAAGVPIVPVVLSGTRECMPRGSLLVRAGHVRVTVGAPIPTAGMHEDDRDVLLDRVRSAAAALLLEHGVSVAPQTESRAPLSGSPQPQ